MTGPGAVVLGGDYRGLGIVRSLGRRGVEVWVVHGTDTRATRSRYCRRAFACADVDAVPFLRELAQKHRLDGWVLFPTSDESAWVVSRHADTLADHYRLTTPDRDTFAAVADKAALHRFASAHGIATPQTWFPRGADDVADLDAAFPLVVKPTRRQAMNALTFDKAWRVDDRDALLRRYAQALAVLPPEEVMIQEWVPGDGDSQYSFAAVCRDGEPLLSLTARRARQYPRDFGRASTYVETVDHPGVAKEAQRLLQELALDGLVEVEFKQDTELKLLDVNLRVWGWHSVGASAGVDFAHAAYRTALGEQVPARVGTPGVRWARLSVDVPYALADLATGRLRARDYLRTLRPPLDGPIWARDDPRPVLSELASVLRGPRRRPRTSGAG